MSLKIILKQHLQIIHRITDSNNNSDSNNSDSNKLDNNIHKRLILMDDGIALYLNKSDNSRFLYDTKKKTKNINQKGLKSFLDYYSQKSKKIIDDKPKKNFNIKLHIDEDDQVLNKDDIDELNRLNIFYKDKDNLKEDAFLDGDQIIKCPVFKTKNCFLGHYIRYHNVENIGYMCPYKECRESYIYNFIAGIIKNILNFLGFKNTEDEEEEEETYVLQKKTNLGLYLFIFVAISVAILFFLK